jgi:hypothetical protein
LDKLEEAEKKRQNEELEAKGEHEKLANQRKEELAAKDKELAASKRNNELLKAVTASDANIPKAGLMDLAEWVDHQTDAKLSIDEVIEKAVEKAATFAPTGDGETKSWGTSGAARGAGKSTAHDAAKALVELGIKAKGGDRNAEGRYVAARADYIKNHGPIPPSIAQEVTLGKT